MRTTARSHRPGEIAQTVEALRTLVEGQFVGGQVGGADLALGDAVEQHRM
jgi:hypothetical protein